MPLKLIGLHHWQPYLWPRLTSVRPVLDNACIRALIGWVEQLHHVTFFGSINVWKIRIGCTLYGNSTGAVKMFKHQLETYSYYHTLILKRKGPMIHEVICTDRSLTYLLYYWFSGLEDDGVSAWSTNPPPRPTSKSAALKSVFQQTGGKTLHRIIVCTIILSVSAVEKSHSQSRDLNRIQWKRHTKSVTLFEHFCILNALM